MSSNFPKMNNPYLNIEQIPDLNLNIGLSNNFKSSKSVLNQNNQKKSSNNNHKYSFNSMTNTPIINNNDKTTKRKNSHNVNDFVKPSPDRNSEKYTCKYEILIDNDLDFQVGNKIIGIKGSNMKNIVDICRKNSMVKYDEPVKLRLRGKGSGFKEGPENKESLDPFQLCVSSKYQEMFEMACKCVEELLTKIYEDFIKYLDKKGNLIIKLDFLKKLENQNVIKLNNNAFSNSMNNNFMNQMSFVNK